MFTTSFRRQSVCSCYGTFLWVYWLFTCYRHGKKKEKTPSVGYFQLVNMLSLLAVYHINFTVILIWMEQSVFSSELRARDNIQNFDCLNEQLKIHWGLQSVQRWPYFWFSIYCFSKIMLLLFLKFKQILRLLRLAYLSRSTSFFQSLHFINL